LVGISKAFRDENEATKSHDIEYCIECGKKLPKPLADKWLPIIEKQFNVSTTLQESINRLPQEYTNTRQQDSTKDKNFCFTLEKTITYIPKILENVNKQLNVKLVNTTDTTELQKQIANTIKHIKELESILLLAQHITNPKDCTKIVFYLYRHLLTIIEDLDTVSGIAIKAFQSYVLSFLGDDEYPYFTPGARLELDEE
jgi:hypothetical protein